MAGQRTRRAKMFPGFRCIVIDRRVLPTLRSRPESSSVGQICYPGLLERHLICGLLFPRWISNLMLRPASPQFDVSVQGLPRYVQRRHEDSDESAKFIREDKSGCRQCLVTTCRRVVVWLGAVHGGVVEIRSRYGLACQEIPKSSSGDAFADLFSIRTYHGREENLIWSVLVLLGCPFSPTDQE